MEMEKLGSDPDFHLSHVVMFFYVDVMFLGEKLGSDPDFLSMVSPEFGNSSAEQVSLHLPGQKNIVKPVSVPDFSPPQINL